MLERSEAEWRDLMRELPNDPDPLVGLGMALRWQDRPGAAEPYLRKAAREESEARQAAEVLAARPDIQRLTPGGIGVALA